MTMDTAKYSRLEPHQRRVIDEGDQLQQRVADLGGFLASGLYQSLDVAEQDRLSRQLAHMIAYLGVLIERIAAFPPPPPGPLTTDPTDPRLGHGSDVTPGPQKEAYLVLSEEERAKGFVRPLRFAYVHRLCSVDPKVVTRMGYALSETYARDPKFYGATYCCACRMHKPVGEFTWNGDGEVVGS